MRLLIEFLISVLSSIGFGVITNIPKRALLPAGITGGVSWCAYWRRFVVCILAHQPAGSQPHIAELHGHGDHRIAGELFCYSSPGAG